MNNLTTLQQGLIDGLIKEFTKINPKPSANGAKRFSFDTIAECQQEEERFLGTIGRHNDTMIKVFDKQFKDELKAFEKEFGKVFTTQIGYTSNKSEWSDYKHFIEANKNKKSIQDTVSSYEMQLFIVSKTKKYGGDIGNSSDKCNGKEYFKLQVDFKREKVTIKLESGKNVEAYKIVGLIFCNNEYHYRHNDNVITTSTLDEFIQTNKQLQRVLVEMAS